jgi:hypothetical protein
MHDGRRKYRAPDRPKNAVTLPDVPVGEANLEAAWHFTPRHAKFTDGERIPVGLINAEGRILARCNWP